MIFSITRRTHSLPSSGTLFYERQLKLMVIMQMISFALSAERLKERHRMQMSQSYYRQN